MYEPYGYSDNTNYISKKDQIERELQQNRINDCKEFASVEYNATLQAFVFKNVKGQERGYAYMSDIIPSELIKDAYYDSTTKSLIITFVNGKTVTIPLDDLIDVVEAGDGLKNVDGKFYINLTEDCERFLTVDENGLKLSGVQDAINVERDRAISAETEEHNRATQAEDDLAAAIRQEAQERSENDNLIRQTIGNDFTTNPTETVSFKFNALSEKTQKEIDDRGTAINNEAQLRELGDNNLNSTKANKADVYTKNEVYTKDEVYTKEECDERFSSGGSVTTDAYTKAESDARFQPIGDYATSTELQAVNAKVDAIDLTPYATTSDVNTALEAKADKTDTYTKQEVDNKDAALENAINTKVAKEINGTNGKALIFNESDGGGAKFEHSDGTWSFAGVNDGGENGIAGQIYALKKNAENKLEGTRIDVTKNAMYYTVGADAASNRMVADNEIATKGNIDEAISGKADADTVYTQAEVDALLAEKESEIDKIISDYKKLKEIVGDLGGAVEYSVPADGKLTDMLKKSGIIKLTEDVESNTYAGGITAKNITTLNLNGKTITTTANTTTNPSIMVRGTQQFTIQGSGTLNANGHIAIHASSVDSVINLGGTALGRPTYITNRSGGELIYCEKGTINITNGVFRNDGEDKSFMLNCYDANYKDGTAKIIVTGGKFYDFNPADNSAEGEHTNFVAEGYHVEESTDGESTVYTVKKDA